MRFGPNSPEVNFRSDSREFSPVFKEAHTKATKIFEERQIKPADFSSLYGAATVEADQRKLEEVKAKFNMDARGLEAKKVAGMAGSDRT
jgi:hypothetical protein